MGAWGCCKKANKEASVFFLKKEPKTFCMFGPGPVGVPGLECVKVFCFFFSKKKVFLPTIYTSVSPLSNPQRIRQKIRAQEPLLRRHRNHHDRARQQNRLPELMIPCAESQGLSP